MQLIENKLKLSGYLQTDIIDKSFDTIENIVIELDVVFSVEPSSLGISIEIYQVKSIKWSYTGVKYTDDDSIENEIMGSSDDTWTLDIRKSKTDDENYGLFINNVHINLETKKIDIDFEC